MQVDPSDPAARHVAAGAHGGLLTLERTPNEKGVMRTVIVVDQTRETIPFFGSTAAVEGWRVCIVDTVDELNRQRRQRAAEDPRGAAAAIAVPAGQPRAGALLPTILSRCRKLPLRPLATADVIGAAAAATDIGDRRSRAERGGGRGGGQRRRGR